MPTLKINKKDGGKYVRIVESYRDESGIACMRTLVSLGKLNKKKIASLKRLGAALYQAADSDPELLNKTIIEHGRHNYGDVLACKHVLCYYSLDKQCKGKNYYRGIADNSFGTLVHLPGS
jgi:hypothetical protein